MIMLKERSQTFKLIFTILDFQMLYLAVFWHSFLDFIF
ncbi:hypothetical protein LEP1GSC085_2360 [Leptospira interrogans str. L0996]|nr:hypothetical protein LEP1GSC085_2360 [Leptospira interrogans str. L0996]